MIADAPPPAHVITVGGRTRMAQSTFCWEGRCVDYVSPDDRDDLPTVRLGRGEVVRFRLRFDPKRVRLVLPRREIRLQATRRPRWKVTGRPRWLELFATVERGDASYAISVRMAP